MLTHVTQVSGGAGGMHLPFIQDSLYTISTNQFALLVTLTVLC